MGKSAEDITDPAQNINKKRSGSDEQADVEDGPAHVSGPAMSTASTPSKPSKKRATDTKRDKKYYALANNPLYRLMKKLSEDAFAKHGEPFEFRYNDLVQILIRMKAILSKEPPLVRTVPPVVIVGDIHGQFADLSRVMEHFGNRSEEKPGWLSKNFVFLGDYVDRGKQSLEVIVFVFLMKIIFPNQVFLLRGNHECKPINRVYGFQTELADRFENQEHGSNLFHMFNEAFTHLPLACLVGGIVLCMHGGISPRLTSLDEINKIPKPLVDPNSHPLACDLMWADPMISLNGFKPNAIRGVSVHFGEDVLHSTMARLGVKLIVRGHQMMMNGYNFFGHKKLVTVFTAASYYPDRANRGAVLHMDEHGHMGFHVISPHAPGGGGEKVFTGEHEDANRFDVGYILSVADEKKMSGGGARM